MNIFIDLLTREDMLQILKELPDTTYNSRWKKFKLKRQLLKNIEQGVEIYSFLSKNSRSKIFDKFGRYVKNVPVKTKKRVKFLEKLGKKRPEYNLESEIDKLKRFKEIYDKIVLDLKISLISEQNPIYCECDSKKTTQQSIIDFFETYPLFDCAPLRKNKKVVGFVDRNLRNQDGTFSINTNENEYLIKNDIEIQKLITEMVQNKEGKAPQISYLIKYGNEYSIIHKSDLIRPPVSILISVTIQYLEHLTNYIIMKIFKDDGWISNEKPILSNTDKYHILFRYLQTMKNNTELGLIYNADLRHKFLILKSVLEDFNNGDIEKINDLRNIVFHTRQINPDFVLKLYPKILKFIENLQKFSKDL